MLCDIKKIFFSLIWSLELIKPYHKLLHNCHVSSWRPHHPDFEIFDGSRLTQPLTHCSIINSYVIVQFDQYFFRWWLSAMQHQAITPADVVLLSVFLLYLLILIWLFLSAKQQEGTDVKEITDVSFDCWFKCDWLYIYSFWYFYVNSAPIDFIKQFIQYVVFHTLSKWNLSWNA